MQTYDEFIATIDPEDLYNLNLLAQGEQPGYIDPTGIAEMDARMDRLLTAGYALRVECAREIKEGTTWHFYKAFAHPQIKAYVARAAKERVLLSRAPLPA